MGGGDHQHLANMSLDPSKQRNPSPVLQQAPLRPPRRRAASGPQYNLAAVWLPLDQYLSESSDGIEADSEDVLPTINADVGQAEPIFSRRRVQKPWSSATHGDDDSDSDEYRAEDDLKPARKPERRTRSSSSELDRPKKSRRKRKVMPRTPKCSKVSSDEAQRLVDYLFAATNWEDTARHVFAMKLGRVDAVPCQAIVAQDLFQKRQREKAVKLRALWKDHLSKAIVEMHR